MKMIIITVLTFFLQTCYGQKCNCDSNPNLIENISCDTIHFKNHSKQQYRSFICNSSWFTYEKKGKKDNLFFGMYVSRIIPVGSTIKKYGI